MKENALKANWAERGFSFGVGTIKIGDGIVEAVHDDQEELVVMVGGKGKLEFTIEDKSFIVEDEEGEIFIPAKTKHSIENLGSTDTKIYYGYRSAE